MELGRLTGEDADKAQDDMKWYIFSLINISYRLKSLQESKPEPKKSPSVTNPLQKLESQDKKAGTFNHQLERMQQKAEAIRASKQAAREKRSKQIEKRRKEKSRKSKVNK